MLKDLQKTLKDKIQLRGVGLHSGQKVDLCLKPANVNTGIVFRRTDIESTKNTIKATYENVCSATLCTKIKNAYGVSVATIEHLMAAFYGESIDNVLVEINGPEVPIMDGSAIAFVDAIRSAGIAEQKDTKNFIKVLKKVEIKDGLKSISLEPLENDFKVNFTIIYKNKFINTQTKEISLSRDNLSSIYDSRTFCLFDDIEKIKSQGLAQGGSLENAIVVKEDKILNEGGLRHKDEFVSHKILDCLGDFMLSGYKVFGSVKSVHGGHQLTTDLLKKFFSDKKNWQLEKFENKDKKPKEAGYLQPIAVNA